MTKRNPAAIFDAAIVAAQDYVNAQRWGEAIAALKRALAIRPDADGAWRALGDASRAAGDTAGASRAHERAAALSSARSPLKDAVDALAADRLASAEAIVRERLAKAPTDLAAIVLLADLALRAGKPADAVRFLRRALEIAPDNQIARQNLARVLYDNRNLPEALAEFDRLLTAHPKHVGYRNTRAAILDMFGDYEGAAAAYRAMLADDPDQPLVWMTLGNVLKTIGDTPAAVDAFRRSLALAPGTGESWWSLANLKSFRFAAADIAAMQAALARGDLSEVDRVGIDFALGKAFEDEGCYAQSFAHYEAGNRRQLATAPHDPEELGIYLQRCAAFFTPALFAARAGSGDPASDPIFVVGMPRSGSTLVEQILAAHPAIEGTMELPELPRIARALGGLTDDPANAPYPDNLARLSDQQLAALGREYLARAGRWRRTDRPFFVDKLPMNFVSVGLIRLILPNAKIIDTRRHPLGCGFSVFKQYFPTGVRFSNSVADVGRFYADYTRVMKMWDACLPGHVHHIVYEKLVADTEAEVRRLLDYLGLPFDPACLAFHSSGRAVRTPSAEQVRQPIYTGAIDHWRHYEPWLGPMKDALAEVWRN